MAKMTLEQLRAQFALGKIRTKKGTPKQKDYLIQLRQLPAQLHWGGLGQTVASLLADRENVARQEICTWIEEWLRKPPVNYPKNQSLIDCIVERGDLYIAATREVRALAVWLKKFAEAFLDPPEPKKKEERDGTAAAPPAG